jgi:hypothetical protein
MDANPFLKLSVAARDYIVPYRTLLQRRDGSKPSNSRGEYNKKPNSVQDQALRDYTVILYSCKIPANLETVLIVASFLFD